MTATVTSTAGDATLTVADPSATADRPPGQRRVRARRAAAGRAATHARRERQAAAARSSPRRRQRRPDELLTYNGPVAETDTLNFKQTIGATEALRTGGYSQDADLHAVDDQPVVDSDQRATTKGRPAGGPLLLSW